MLSTVSIVFPVFALIALGYGARRRHILGPAASTELNRFVVWMGLPALLFRITATADWATVWQWEFMIVFSTGGALVFAMVTVGVILRGRTLPDASIDGLNAAYCNTGYMGFPLCLLMFGEQSLALVTVATIFTVCILFAVAVVLVEIGVQSDRRPGRLAVKVTRSLMQNPLLVAPLLGDMGGNRFDHPGAGRSGPFLAGRSCQSMRSGVPGCLSCC